MSEGRWEPGSILGSYELIEEVGRGALGIVYRARHVHLDRLAAVKVLHPQWTATGDFLQRFREEGRVLALLEHPNILRVYDAGEHRGVFFLAMQHLEGRTLEQFLVSTVPQRAAVHVARQVAAALAYAHARGVIHRDVKPANIMVGARGDVTLMDFGVARLRSSPAMTLPGAQVGTPYYMAPEQIQGRKTDARVDLYALGVVLHQMLAGQPPFAGTDTEAVFHGHVHEEPPPLGDVCPEWLRRVVRKALAKNPDERFHTAEEFAQALASDGDEETLGTLGVPAVSPAAAPPVRRDDARPTWPRAAETRLIREERTVLSLDVARSRNLKHPGQTLVVQERFALFRDYVRRNLEAHGGEREALWSGDGLLALFREPVGGALCARDILNGLPTFNANHPDETPITVRMGVHRGPILRDWNQPLGEVVSSTLDLAAHLQKYGSENAVLVTEPVYQELPDPQGWGPVERDLQARFEVPVYCFPAPFGLEPPTPEVPADRASDAPRGSSGLRLGVLVGERSSLHEVEREVVIGRPDTHPSRIPKIVIDGDDAISRRHAQISLLGATYLLEDLGSANGTMVNGEWLHAGDPVPLNPGDEIRIGEKTTLRVLPSA